MTLRSVSVIVCSHNRADQLPRLIGQLRNQNHPEGSFEIVVVDNGSIDHTQQIVAQCAGEPGAPVKYVVENRPGITFARNRGALEAHYDHLAYIDDDCTVESDWLSNLIQGFDLHNDVAVVGGKVILDWDQNPKPIWLRPELEPWLAANGHLGDRPRILDKNARVIECNMALTREAWQANGGFLGMEQFGSKHMAAGEVLYLLHQLEISGGKVAYVPGAVVHHHVGLRSQRWMISRSYWQGISDGILDHIIHKRSWPSMAGFCFLNIAATIVLLGYACTSYLKPAHSKGLFNLLRSVRRLGLAVSIMHLAGDWSRVRSWTTTHQLAT
jgi:glycosyltransferase involved in cell wall biosynthesis